VSRVTSTPTPQSGQIILGFGGGPNLIEIGFTRITVDFLDGIGEDCDACFIRRLENGGFWPIPPPWAVGADRPVEILSMYPHPPHLKQFSLDPRQLQGWRRKSLADWFIGRPNESS
jgi:hypothetical protein